ncbi:MAG: phosphoglycolate phosphatase [Gammaproteobacteria bacterium]|nr:phosphoglycolate phosphatase [Gammaproteobacteria bacterium]
MPGSSPPPAAPARPLRRPRAVLLDLDGTLADTAPDLVSALNHALARLGRPACDAERVRPWLGSGVETLVQRALAGGNGAAPAPAELHRDAAALLLEFYGRNTCRYSSLYPGVLEGLDYLRDQGIRLSCVTNKSARFSGRLLEKLGIRDRFGIVVSGDTLARKKPHPEPLLHAARQLRAAPGESLMIGDSQNDVEAARNAGMPILCVDYGYNSGMDIRDCGPDFVLDSLRRLRELF